MDQEITSISPSENQGFTHSSPKAIEGAVKKHCFLCALARYTTAFVLGVVVGLIWGAI